MTHIHPHSSKNRDENLQDMWTKTPPGGGETLEERCDGGSHQGKGPKSSQLEYLCSQKATESTGSPYICQEAPTTVPCSARLRRAKVVACCLPFFRNDKSKLNSTGTEYEESPGSQRAELLMSGIIHTQSVSSIYHETSVRFRVYTRVPLPASGPLTFSSTAGAVWSGGPAALFPAVLLPVGVGRWGRLQLGAGTE